MTFKKSKLYRLFRQSSNKLSIEIKATVSDRGRIGHLLHHVLVAIILAATFLTLEKLDLLNWLDSITLRLASSLRHDVADFRGAEHGADQSEAPAAEPIVVALTQAYWERELNQQSPIDRDALVALLGQIASLSPDIIAVDLDLSPGPSPNGDKTSQANLDAQLAELARRSVKKVIVTVPLPVETRDALETKLVWMQKLCRAGVVFAYSTVPVSQNLALRFNPQIASLGLVAAQYANPSVLHEYSERDEPPLCELALRGLSSTPFLSTTFSPEIAFSIDEFEHHLPLDMSRLPERGTSLFVIDSSSDIRSLPPMNRKAVFVGSNFSQDDEFLTIAGSHAGVMVHAATYATAYSGQSRLSHLAAFFCDVLLGTVVAYLFTWSWSRYRRSWLALSNARDRLFSRYVKTRSWVVANFLLLAVGLAVIIAYASTLLHLGMWSNPSAMILGMFAKAFLATRNESSDGSIDRLQPSSDRIRIKANRIKVGILDLILLSPVLAYSLTLLWHK